jgi:mRNA interferase MazF
MAAPAAGAVVLVRFPFSDLSNSKLRPAVVLANVGREDFILCQITSNPYADPQAVELAEASFQAGSLERTSYARPSKLFTSSESLVARQIGQLKPEAQQRVTEAVVRLLRAGQQEH